jgi:Ca-activated chloride channel family protein
MRMRVGWTCVFACLAVTRTVGGQATFSSGTNPVAIYVTVVGEGGALQSGLSAKDFDVRDDGELLTITQFESGSLPITMAVLLDDSPSLRASQPVTQAAATALIRRLKPGDRALIGVFSRTVRLNGNLTGSQDELLEQLHSSLPLMAGTALWDAVNAGVSALEEEHGRRIVLLLTDGDDNSSQADASVIAANATREGVMIYAIGIRGADQRLSKGLKDLALETGGWFFELKRSDNLLSTFQRVADELRNQYLLGFSPAVLDGKVHRLDVNVKRRGLTARARRSYVAAPSGAAPAAGQ